MRSLSILGLAIGLLSTLYYILDSRLENFYIFEPAQLHQLALAAIEAHGNDTAAVVRYIADDLNAKHKTHVNMDEEWMFNNAGGAMGAMWILHASKLLYVIF